ncbi:hypothetical protein [Peptostreptococcus russellii]|uniref:hypothetical protein n=1 Tax=Peptostreptococcus russellii TaxID=215200 RepID=UPI003F58D841
MFIIHYYFLQLFLSYNEFATLNNTIKENIDILKKMIDNEYFIKVLDSIGFPENWEKLQTVTKNKQ